jgi:hypothetical protein
VAVYHICFQPFRRSISPHPGQDEQDAEHPPRVAGLAEEDHSEQGGSRPPRSRSTPRRPSRPGGSSPPGRAGGNPRSSPPPTRGKARGGSIPGFLDPHRPARLEGPGGDEYQPGHLPFPSKRSGAGGGEKARGR